LLQERVILGIDPGTIVMGYGVVQVMQGQISVLQYGVLKLGHYANHALKLQQIFTQVIRLIDEFAPDEAALEAPFYGKNVQSMLKLGKAQGVAMAAALSREVAITEYASRKIKQAVTGNGHASKEQVAQMLMRLLSFSEVPEQLDATDALAVAVCHAYQNNKYNSSAKSWKQLLKANPSRLYEPNQAIKVKANR
jgi:crossover junction endodeoxyribonuclease RuvC